MLVQVRANKEKKKYLSQNLYIYICVCVCPKCMTYDQTHPTYIQIR